MGTRSLIAVQIDGEYKIAQYAQFDGYPAGQGMTCLEFARSIVGKAERERFAAKVRSCRWLSAEEAENLNKMIDTGQLKNWREVYPELTREIGGDILKFVMYGHPGVKLSNSIAFAGESLFCEWAWVIDLDAGTFEAFAGFNEDRPLTSADRFHEYEKITSVNGSTYYGVVLMAKWPLDALPTDEEFYAALGEA